VTDECPGSSTLVGFMVISTKSEQVLG
jgi:hypothetical protein